MRQSAPALIAIPATLFTASPALALPQLTGGNADYFLMPLLGYCGIIAVARLLYLRERRRRARD